MLELKCKKKECDGDCSPHFISSVSEVLSDHELIVYPTETLYGLGADPFHEGMIKKIREVKEAPPHKKISTAYHDLEHASEFVDIPDPARKLGEKFLPGPLCIVVKTPEGTEGIRVPDHPLTKKIIEDFGPITSTSANLHGGPDPVDVETSKLHLRGKVKLYVNCGPCRYGIGSTVVKVDEKGFDILREGYITKKEIGDVLEVEPR